MIDIHLKNIYILHFKMLNGMHILVGEMDIFLAFKHMQFNISTISLFFKKNLPLLDLHLCSFTNCLFS